MSLSVHTAVLLCLVRFESAALFINSLTLEAVIVLLLCVLLSNAVTAVMVTLLNDSFYLKALKPCHH